MERITIRTAEETDYPGIYDLIRAAFKDDPNSDQNEAEIVQKLQREKSFKNELSIVACYGNTIAGYILLSEVIITGKQQDYKALALAPLAVLPSFQKQGIGSALVKKAHQTATDLGYELIILIGHKEYYPRFGYTEASKHGITVPFDIPSPYVMIRELRKDAALEISGMVKYPTPFYL